MFQQKIGPARQRRVSIINNFPSGHRQSPNIAVYYHRAIGLDRADGFIHLSTSNQLALTIRSYFDQYEIIVLLQIETDNIRDRLVFEESDSEERNGKFPHLYGKLATEDIFKKLDLKRSAFELPIDVLKESENLT